VPLKIAIEATAAFKQSAGVGRYTRGLILALRDLTHAHFIQLVSSSDSPEADWANGFKQVRYPFSERTGAWLWQRLNAPLPIETWTGKIDVFHGPNFTLPTLRKAKGITTIHDLSFLSSSPWHPPATKKYLTTAVTRSIKNSHALIADSESTKRDILSHFSFPDEKIHVIYPGIEPQFRVLEEPRAKTPVPKRFLLAVGTVEPRKNLSTIIEALAHLDNDLHLLIAGGSGWLEEKTKLHAKVEALKLQDRVHFLGFVPDEDLITLYNLAQAVVYPSFYEGFGLPVLEAMACGTPVVCARNSSLPEAGGDAVVYLDDARDAKEMAQKIEKLLSERAKYRMLGLERVKKFTWESAAKRALSVYEA